MFTNVRYKLHWLVGIFLLLLSGTVQAQTGGQSIQQPDSGQGMSPHKWARSLPAKACPWSATDSNCHGSSPAVADVNGDGREDIVVATNNGHVVVVNHQGNILWDTDVAGAFGVAPNSQVINSSPAVGDVDLDGRAEIVVGVGTTRANECTQGGVIMLDHRGRPEANWPRVTDDLYTPPAGCRDSVYSSPALGDLDNDGDLEIVAGGFDKRIYAWHHDGSLLPGFSPTSHHKAQFPTWTDLDGRLSDTIWSSPALGDLDGDGYLDIVIGSDEGNVGGDWVCPYRLPPGWYPGYCGGSIYAVNRFGQILPGFPRYIHETVQSTPAVADINDDGQPEIIVGTGSYYFRNSPDHPQTGFRLFVFDNQGRDFPGWAGGKSVGGPVAASPAVGDISGDGRLEIVVPVMESKMLHAWHADGRVVGGFPMKPLDLFGNASASFDVGIGTVLADYDGDQKMEILINQAWTVTVVDGNGAQLTANNYPGDARPIYYAEGSLLNTPAVADLDGDNELELVAQNSTLYVWDLPGSRVDEGAWPTFKRDSAGTSYVPMPPRLENVQAEVVVLAVLGDGGGGGATMRAGSLTLNNPGDGTLEWSATAPDGVTLSTYGGVMENQEQIQVQVDEANYPEGVYDLGDITVSARNDGEQVEGSPLSVPVHLHVDDFSFSFLPSLVR